MSPRTIMTYGIQHISVCSLLQKDNLYVLSAALLEALRVWKGTKQGGSSDLDEVVTFFIYLFMYLIYLFKRGSVY